MKVAFYSIIPFLYVIATFRSSQIIYIRIVHVIIQLRRMVNPSAQRKIAIFKPNFLYRYISYITGAPTNATYPISNIPGIPSHNSLLSIDILYRDMILLTNDVTNIFRKKRAIFKLIEHFFIFNSVRYRSTLHNL